jgi:type IV pilus assembly protein PilV
MLTYSSTRPRQQRGATLIEILVTFLILSFGLMAIGTMQAFSLSSATSTSNRAIAISMASEYTEMMRANPAAVAAGSYDIALDYSGSTNIPDVDASDTCSYPNCTATTLATFDKAVFQARVRSMLPAGTVVMTRPTVAGAASTRQANVWIIWSESKNFAAPVSGDTSSPSETAFDACPAAVQTMSPLPRCYFLRITL